MHKYGHSVPICMMAILCLILASCVTVVMSPPGQEGSAPVINLFDANPRDISPGTTSMIRWDVSNATSVSIDQNIGIVTPSGSMSVSPVGTTTYTLTATNAAGNITATTQIRVSGGASPSISNGLPLINSFTAMPPSISTDSSSMLSWDVANATSVSISPSVGAVGNSGSLYLSPATTTNYTLTASNATGSTVATVQIAVPATSSAPTLADLPIIHSFTANPTSIAAGELTTLSWNVSNANKVTILPTFVRNLEGDVGDLIGSAPLSLDSTTSYTLTATNNWGMRSRTITVSVYSQSIVSEPLNWTGTWNTNWGTMYLSQSAGKVTGTYAHDTGEIVGYISKNLTGDQLIGTWSEDPTYAPPNDAGDIEWYASPDFNSFTGKWRYGSEGEWDGTWTGTRVTSKLSFQ